MIHSQPALLLLLRVAFVATVHQHRPDLILKEFQGGTFRVGISIDTRCKSGTGCKKEERSKE